MTEPESRFQPAHRPRGPSAALPDGVTPPGTRKGRSEGPQAQIPEYVGPPAPKSTVGVAMLFMLGVGVQVLLNHPSAAGVVLAVVFLLAGVVGCAGWLRAWRAWRRAWAFEKRLPWWPKVRSDWSRLWKQWRQGNERARAKGRPAARRRGGSPRRRRPGA